MTVQDQITTFWNTVAPHYEAHPGNTVPVGSPEHELWVDLFRRALPVAAGDVLDVCTGTGFVACIASGLGHRVTAIDLAPAMLDVAQRTAEQRGTAIRFVEGDAVAPPFDPASFDVITCRNGLWTLREPHRAVASWRRLLRPQGRVVVVDGLQSRAAPDPESAGERFFHAHYTPEVQQATALMHAEDETDVGSVFVEAGFNPVTAERLAETFGDGERRPYLIVAYR